MIYEWNLPSKSNTNVRRVTEGSDMKVCCCGGCGFNVIPFSAKCWGVDKFCIIKGLLEPITVVIADDNGILPRELSAESRGEGIANVFAEFCSVPKSK